MTIEYERARDYLRAKRDFYGAETPIGHRCSNLDEALLNYPSASPEAKAELDKNMARWIADLEKLCAAAQAVDG